jgi:hypothetical protein
LLLLLLALLLGAGAAPLAAQDCRRGDRPAATLLFPYFEVDIDNPGGSTTLIAINNTNTGVPVLAHVVVWTDWGLATVAFDVFLRSGDVQTINLRDVFASGGGPVTGPGAAIFSGCTDTIGGPVLPPGVLQTAHTGRSTLGKCFSSSRADTSIATGYITVDVAGRCSSAGTTPASPGYFSGGSRVALNDNVLWGDIFYVDPDGNFAGGQTAVHIVADPPRFGPGSYTFYGKWVGFDGSDERTPLSNRWGTRFITGGAFTGGTHLIVWRDTRFDGITPVDCGTSPSWVPLGELGVVARDEGANVQSFPSPSFFDLATQRVDVDAAINPSFLFGWLDLRLDHGDNTPAQAWVGWDANASGRFNVNLAGVPFNDPCVMTP